MTITQAQSSAVTRAVKRVINDEFEASGGTFGGWEQIVEVNRGGDSRILELDHAGTVTRMEDVTDHNSAPEAAVDDYSQNVEARTYQGTLRFPWDWIRDDKLNQLGSKAGTLAEEASYHKSERFSGLYELNSGDGPLAFDDLPVFQDTRGVGKSGNIDNKLAALPTTTIAEVQAAITASRDRMRTFQDDQGRIIAKVPNVIVIGPEKENIFWKALNTESEGNLNENIIAANAERYWTARGYLVMINELMDGSRFYMHHAMGSLMPWCMHDYDGPNIMAADSVNDATNIQKRRNLYSVDQAYEFAANMPWHSIRIDAA